MPSAADIVNLMGRPRTRMIAAIAAIPIIALAVAAELIWNFDWSTFLPDLIVGGFTGLAVGFVLWRVDLASQQREQKTRREAEWAAARRAVSLAIEESYVYHSGKLDLVGFGIEGVRKATKNLPLHSWSAELEDPAIELLIDYLAAVESCNLAGRALDIQLNTVVYAYDGERSYMAMEILELARQYADFNRWPRILLDDEDTGRLWEILTAAAVQERIIPFRTQLLLVESIWCDLAASLLDDEGATNAIADVLV